jgi:hypothetical protein
MFQKTTFSYHDPSASPNYSGFNFGCAQEPKDGVIKLVSGTHTCREGLFHNMRSRISGSGGNQPTDRMRMIFRWYASKNDREKQMAENEAWALRSVSVLQAFDKIAGWPLTRVYKLDVGSSNNSWLQCYYYWSSRRWMKASYLVSLYIMLVRMCKDERIRGFKNFDGLVKVIEKVISSGTSLKYDHSYVKSSMPYWEALMKGYPDLFRQHKMPYYWDTSRLGGSSGGSEGIQYLVNGDTRYTDVRKKLLEIKRDLEAKKKK